MKLTQGEVLASSLKRWPATYGDMLKWSVSTCPHRRMLEWLDLPENRKTWALEKGWRPRTAESGPEFLVTWRIVRKPKGVG